MAPPIPSKTKKPSLSTIDHPSMEMVQNPLSAINSHPSPPPPVYSRTNKPNNNNNNNGDTVIYSNSNPAANPDFDPDSYQNDTNTTTVPSYYDDLHGTTVKVTKDNNDYAIPSQLRNPLYGGSQHSGYAETANSNNNNNNNNNYNNNKHSEAFDSGSMSIVRPPTYRLNSLEGSESIHLEAVTEDQFASKKKEKRYFFGRLTKNQVIIATVLLLLLIVFAIIFAVLITVLPKKLAEEAIASSEIVFESITITPPSNSENQNQVHVLGYAYLYKVNMPSMISEVTTTPMAVEVTASGGYIGTLMVDALVLAGAGPFPMLVNQTIILPNDKEAFTKFTKDVLYKESAQWSLKTTLSMKASFIGIPLSIDDLTFTKTVTLKGMKGLPNVEMKSFDLSSSTPTTIKFNLTTTILNPSIFSVPLGTLNVTLFYQGTYLGWGVAPSVIVTPSNYTTMRIYGEIHPEDLSVAQDVFSSYLGGGSFDVQAKFRNDSTSIDFFKASFDGFSLNTTIAGSVDPLFSNMTILSGSMMPIDNSSISFGAGVSVYIKNPLGANSPITISNSKMSLSMGPEMSLDILGTITSRRSVAEMAASANADEEYASHLKRRGARSNAVDEEELLELERPFDIGYKGGNPRVLAQHIQMLLQRDDELRAQLDQEEEQEEEQDKNLDQSHHQQQQSDQEHSLHLHRRRRREQRQQQQQQQQQRQSLLSQRQRELLKRRAVAPADGPFFGNMIVPNITIPNTINNYTAVNITMNNRFNLDNPTLFTAFINRFLYYQKVGLTLSGYLNATVQTPLGKLNLTNIRITQFVSVDGLSGLNQLDLVSFEIPGDSPSGLIIKANSTLFNPSVLSMSMGGVGLDVFYSTTKLGYIFTKNLTVSPGMNTLEFTGYFSPNQSDSLAISRTNTVLSQWLRGGNSFIDVKGSYVTANVTWLATSVKYIQTTVLMRGWTAPGTLVTKMEFPVFNVTDQYPLPTAIGALAKISFKSPFNFTFTVSSFSMSLDMIDIGKGTFAHVDVPLMGVLDGSGTSTNTISAIVNNYLVITDTPKFNAFINKFASTSKVKLGLSATATINIITKAGNLTLLGVTAYYEAPLDGLNSLRYANNATSVVVNSVAVQNTRTNGLDLLASMSIYNPSNASVFVKRVVLDMYSGTTKIGEIAMTNLQLLSFKTVSVSVVAVLNRTTANEVALTNVLNQYVNNKPSAVKIVISPSYTDGVLQVAAANVTMDSSIGGIGQPLITKITSTCFTLDNFSPAAKAAATAVNPLQVPLIFATSRMVLTWSNGDALADFTQPTPGTIASGGTGTIATPNIFGVSNIGSRFFNLLFGGTEYINLVDSTFSVTIGTFSVQLKYSQSNIPLSNSLAIC